MELVEMVATVRDVVPMDQTDEILKQCKWWWCGVSVRDALCKMGATGGVVVRQALVGERWVSSSVIRRVNQGRKCREGMRGVARRAFGMSEQTSQGEAGVLFLDEHLELFPGRLASS